MAATPITPVQPSAQGVAAATPVAADDVNGNSVPNRPGMVLVLENTDAASHTVTFTTTASVGGYAVADPQVTIPAGATRYFSKFSTGAFSLTLTFTADSNLVEVSAYQVQ